MTTYGPWVQPDDTEAAPLNLWWANSTQATGSTATRADSASQTASTLAVKLGTGVGGITAGLTTTATAEHTGAGWLDLGGSIAALGRVSLFAPKVDQLDFPAVPPDEVPSRAVGYEYETPEGVPVEGTVRVYGHLAISSASDRPVLKGANLYRLNEAEYDIDGLSRPTSTWALIVGASTTVLAITAPGSSGVPETRSFNLTGLAPDDSGYIVFGLVSEWLYDDWTYPLGSTAEGNSVRLYGDSSALLPYFTQTYTPPRYRFLYDTDPPLRQFPRSDGLVGTGGARQRGAYSRQGSNRQGWAGTHLRAAGWAAA